MSGSAMTQLPTLWDLATVVLEEAERVCKDERTTTALAKETLIHMIQGYVKNMEVEPAFSYADALADEERPGPGRTRPRVGG